MKKTESRPRRLKAIGLEDAECEPRDCVLNGILIRADRNICPIGDNCMRGRPKKDLREEAAKIRQTIKDDDRIIDEEISFDETFSTGSTLLDLAATGGRIRGGGIPAGIILEIFGPSSSGKTSILAELARSIQDAKGQVKFLDPEARLDKEYMTIYGVSLTQEDYSRPDTVNEMFDTIWDWKPPNPNVVNMIAADSLAALSTELEMESEDKMGMKRAKDFSQGLRKSCRIIANKRYILACTNQERGGSGGSTTTPGGKGIPYYASLRIRVYPNFPDSKITRSKKIGGKSIEKTVGIKSICEIKKSSVDEPFRTAPISIIFGYGIDDIRDQLNYYKDCTGEDSYECFGKTFKSIQPAIEYIEEKNLQNELRERTIIMWEEIEKKFRVERKPKVRFNIPRRTQKDLAVKNQKIPEKDKE